MDYCGLDQVAKGLLDRRAEAGRLAGGAGELAQWADHSKPRRSRRSAVIFTASPAPARRIHPGPAGRRAADPDRPRPWCRSRAPRRDPLGQHAGQPVRTPVGAGPQCFLDRSRRPDPAAHLDQGRPQPRDRPRRAAWRMFSNWVPTRTCPRAGPHTHSRTSQSCSNVTPGGSSPNASTAAIWCGATSAGGRRPAGAERSARNCQSQRSPSRWHRSRG